MWLRVGIGAQVGDVSTRSVAKGLKLLASGEHFEGLRIGGILSGGATGVDLLHTALMSGVLPDVVQVEHVGRSMHIQMRDILELAGYVTQDGGFYFIRRA